MADNTPVIHVYDCFDKESLKHMVSRLATCDNDRINRMAEIYARAVSSAAVDATI